MSHPRQPTPDRSTRVNHGILSPRVTALRGRLDELIRGTLQLAEKLPTTNGELFPHSRDYESVEPHCLLLMGAKPSDTSRLLDLLAGHAISNAGKDPQASRPLLHHCYGKQVAKISHTSDPQATHHAHDLLRHVNFIEARDISAFSLRNDSRLADCARQAELVFFAISASDPSHAASWNHLATWQESELEKVVLVAMPANENASDNEADCITMLAETSRQKLGRALPAFGIKDGIAALRDCLTASLFTPGTGRRTLEEALARGEKSLRRIEDQIEGLNRKIRQQDRFMDDVERGFDSMRASFTARLPGHIEKVAGVFNHEAAIAAAHLKKRLNPFSSIARLFTGGRVGIQMHSVFTDRIQQAVMQIATKDSKAIATICSEHYQRLCEKTKDELGSVSDLPDDVSDTLARAQEHFLGRIEHSAKRGIIDLGFRNPLEKLLSRRNRSLKSFIAVALSLTFLGASSGAMGILWLAGLLCALAALFLTGALWAAWISRRSIISDFKQRLDEASASFANNLHFEYEIAIGTLLAEYATSLKPLRAHVEREKNTTDPLSRRWQELFLGFKALAQDL
jgi:hypothetical protein